MDGRKQIEIDSEEHDLIIEGHNTCCLCGTELKFKHEIDYLNLQVKEDSDCPSCKISMKSKSHGLH